MEKIIINQEEQGKEQFDAPLFELVSIDGSPILADSDGCYWHPEF